MGEIKRSDLFGKLNALAYRAIESATVFCKMRGNPYVELVHWLHQILELQDSDLHHIVRNFNINPSVLAKDITERLDQLPRGSTSITDLSFQVQEAVERGWVYATLLFGDSHVRTGYLVVGMLKTPGLKNVLTSISREFEKVNLETLTDRFDEVVQGSSEDGLSATDGFQVGGGAVPGEASGAMAPAQMGKGQALARFSIDLTESARQGKIDPVIGRDREIRQIVDILMRRRQNNPILTGEAGVGKTAVVEGFALRIAADDVPPSLHNVSLRTLDVGLLQAGASMKGEFENRLRQVIDEVKAAERPTILFIDEAHMLIGAGGAAGTGDAANLLKPALARGELRTIAATTWGEYKKHFEKDAALTRRFQVVQVLEPDEEKALRMMRGLASTLEKHHRVLVLDEALEAAVKLSHRYIPARQLPDKSISLLDTAAARVAVSQSSTPVELDDSRRRIEDLETEMRIVKREHLIGRDGADRQNAIQAAIDTEHQRREALESRWEEEKTLVDEILEIRGKLRIDDEEETEALPDAGDNSDAGNDAAAGEETPPLQESTPDSASDDCSGLLERLGEGPIVMQQRR